MSNGCLETSLTLPFTSRSDKQRNLIVFWKQIRAVTPNYRDHMNGCIKTLLRGEVKEEVVFIVLEVMNCPRITQKQNNRIDIVMKSNCALQNI